MEIKITTDATSVEGTGVDAFVDLRNYLCACTSEDAFKRIEKLWLLLLLEDLKEDAHENHRTARGRR